LTTGEIRNQKSKLKLSISFNDLVCVILLIVVICAGAYFRLVGVNWDDSHHLHPDERFLSMVLASISPVDNAGEYFNTELSSLNPANRGYGFFVYGTLPIFIIRYLGEWLGQTGYDAITILGRYVSAIFDLFTVLLVFLIGKRLHSNRVGLIAACFYALAVLPIQLSHFMTVDTLTNTFGMVTVYIGVWIATRGLHNGGSSSNTEMESTEPKPRFNASDWIPYLLFGVSLGLATASKINAVSLAFFLVFIELVEFLQTEKSLRNQKLLFITRDLLIAGVASFITFRIFQPYAFDGPGFFNFRINTQWWSSMQSLSAQAAGEVDFPPALQWARRPITFAWTNMIQWGMGLPLGIFSWLAFLGMGWAIFRKKQLKNLPIWLWTIAYFLWQGLAWVRSMRYQMLVYPLLAIMAAWGMEKLWSSRDTIRFWVIAIKPKLVKAVGVFLATVIIVSTALYAFAFTRIYTRPHTRVEASNWIYQNIQGPLNLVMTTQDGPYAQPLPYRSGESIVQGETYRIPFKPLTNCTLLGLTLPNVVDQDNLDEPHKITVSIINQAEPGVNLVTSSVEQMLKLPESNWQGGPINFLFDPGVVLDRTKLYFLQVIVESGNGHVLFNGVPSLNISLDGILTTQSLPKITQTFSLDDPYSMDVVTVNSGEIRSIMVPHMVDLEMHTDQSTVELRLSVIQGDNSKVYTSSLTSNFAELGDGRGTGYTFVFDDPVVVSERQSINISLQVVEGNGKLAIFSRAPAHESSWDDALPLSDANYYPYSDNGGLYRGDLNFELYWADDASKLARFESTLDQADYIFISSNRQWGTTTRVPERYPLTSEYYRSLIGCPDGKDIVWCYNVAKPGQFEGGLGFNLVKVFESFPTLGNLELNSQFAEEAFTVYDAPKVLIFQKTSNYDPLKTREILQSVDLSRVVQITAKQADKYKAPNLDGEIAPQSTLLLPKERLEEQRTQGTWSELFDREGLINKYPAFSVIALYLLISLLGLSVYPIIRLVLPGLADKGYPFIRLFGMLILSYLVWLAGSLGVAYEKTTILIILGVIAITGLVLAIIQRGTIKEDLRKNWKYFLLIEFLSLIAFLIFLYIRIQNPDLWHPYKGGEKPMDFSYLNAILKSTTFPPYDPWFAGGYINYYYYGLMIVSVPIKLLGIIPSTAYNIILPLLFSFLFTGSFSVGWNLYAGIRKEKEKSGRITPGKFWIGALWTGLGTAFLLSVLGNLGTVRLLFESLEKLGSGGAWIEDATLVQNLNWLFKGLGLFLKKTPLPLYPGDWYWVPSRAIPGEAITEFPYFTYIYADLHAHLIALPIVVFSVAWGMSVLFSKGQWGENSGKFRYLATGLGLLAGALIIGALKPANTWDYYTFLTLNICILIYTAWRYRVLNLKRSCKEVAGKAIRILWSPVVLLVLSLLLYFPFSYWFGQGFTEVGFWTGNKTPLSSYFIHWGLFLFILFCWLIQETYQWLATTPVSALKKLEPYKSLIITGLVILLMILIGLLLAKVMAALIIIPMGVWVAILLLRAKQEDGVRLILFLVGTALLLTLVVELVYLIGDIGRMNVVFKLYNQAWVLFALSAGFCMISMVKSSIKWRTATQLIWQLLFFGLLVGATLFPLLGTMDKIHDRMDPDAPITLDGMTFMASSTYYDMGMLMDLSEDYWAIRWMQDNVQGSPVVLEGQAYEYKWGNRFTIYTGLPGVVGWNWHQRQQRAILMSNVVQERVDQVGQFYLTEDRSFVESFLDNYNVSYIVCGQLERAFYPGVGLEKFEMYEGIFWDEVFRYGSTVIYEVRR
jgi:YYY domain-containing protein